MDTDHGSGHDVLQLHLYVEENGGRPASDGVQASKAEAGEDGGWEEGSGAYVAFAIP